MKPLLLLFFCLALISCQQQTETPVEVALFGEGIISSELPEFATSVNSDQHLIFFNRTTADRSRMWLMYAKLVGDQWSTPDTLPFSKGDYVDVDPFLSADGSKLYFSSNRPVDSSTTEAGVFNSWFVEKEGEEWSTPTLLPAPLNSDSNEIFMTLTQSGEAYFVSNRSGERTIMMSQFTDGQYQEAKKVELRLEGKAVYASNPCVSSDGRFMIVAVRDPQEGGPPDLYVSWQEKGNWGELINLGDEVNTPYAEFAPGLSKDDQILYFTSERPGIVPEQEEGVRPPGDIYVVHTHTLFAKLRP